MKFTAEEAAQFHVQPGATAILSARMFDWLDEVFAMDLNNVNSSAVISGHTLSFGGQLYWIRSIWSCRDGVVIRCAFLLFAVI